MHRDPLLRLLARYTPLDAQDRGVCDRFRQFVLAHDNCFERSLLAGHVTGSAWLVDPSRSKVLLTHHRKLGRWLQLGGHSDGDADPARTALREAREESGIDRIELLSPDIFDLDIHEIPARGEVPAHLHYDVRLAAIAASTELQRQEEESLDLVWIDIADLESLTQERSMLRMKEKWLLRFVG